MYLSYTCIYNIYNTYIYVCIHIYMYVSQLHAYMYVCVSCSIWMANSREGASTSICTFVLVNQVN